MRQNMMEPRKSKNFVNYQVELLEIPMRELLFIIGTRINFIALMEFDHKIYDFYCYRLLFCRHFLLLFVRLHEICFKTKHDISIQNFFFLTY